MSRLNTLLRASLESSGELPFQCGLEEYMDVCASVESLQESLDLSSALEELSSRLNDVETVIEFSKADGTLTSDQVHMQVSTVERVRSLVTGNGNVTVSIESLSNLDDLLAISQEASDSSKGILRRIWDAFVAILESIYNGIVGILKWITGSNRKAKQVCKEEATLAQKDIVIAKTVPPVVLEKAAEMLPKNLSGILAKKKEIDSVAEEMIVETEKALKETAIENKQTVEEINRVIKDVKVESDVYPYQHSKVPLSGYEEAMTVVGKNSLDNIDKVYANMNRLLSEPLETEGDVRAVGKEALSYINSVTRITEDFWHHSTKEERLEKLVVDIMRNVNELRATIKRIEKDIVGLNPAGEQAVWLNKLVARLRVTITETSRRAVTIQRYVKMGGDGRYKMSVSLAMVRKYIAENKTNETDW